MAVTIKKIAELAGVSRGTVDRALNHRSGVKKEVAEKILQIASDLNYRPNVVAKALANSKRPIIIGVLMNSYGNDFFDEVLRGIQRAKKEIESFGVQLSIRVMKGFDVDKQHELICELEQEGISALAITPIDDIRIIQKLNDMEEKEITVATFNADVDGIHKLAFVGCDYFKSGQIAGDLMGMLTGGKACVGIITGSTKMLGHNLRVQGFETVLKQDFPNIKISNLVENNDDNELSYYKTCELLQTYPQINALYVTAGGVHGAVEAAEVDGRKMIILTHDVTEFVKRKLKDGIISATIGQQPFAQGYTVIRLLFDELMYHKKPINIQNFTTNEIIIKHSILD